MTNWLRILNRVQRKGRVDSQESAPSDCLSGTTIPIAHHEDGRFLRAKKHALLLTITLVVVAHIVVRTQDDSKQLRQHIHHLHSQETRTHGMSQKIH